ncbi:integrase catalytic domain-containing protein [Trichonephila clavipes]|nr:integrase catalytic domain-containing protein [Trichonephila clavipes]
MRCGLGLIRDPQYLKLYRDFIHEYDQLGHTKEVVVENDKSEVAYYMPHHGILRTEKSTTKLRVVFNATNPTSNGLSLNSIQYNGGLVQNDLFTIMVKFREHLYAFMADVKMMSQQPLLRILWKKSPEDPVKTGHIWHGECTLFSNENFTAVIER